MGRWDDIPERELESRAKSRINQQLKTIHCHICKRSARILKSDDPSDGCPCGKPHTFTCPDCQEKEDLK
jgi:hypothetical protein